MECFFCFKLVDDCSVVVDAKVCNLGKVAVNQDVIRRDLAVIVQNKVIESNCSLEANESRRQIVQRRTSLIKQLPLGKTLIKTLP